jgi:hypothetical protein
MFSLLLLERKDGCVDEEEMAALSERRSNSEGAEK